MAFGSSEAIPAFTLLSPPGRILVNGQPDIYLISGTPSRNASQQSQEDPKVSWEPPIRQRVIMIILPTSDVICLFSGLRQLSDSPPAQEAGKQKVVRVNPVHPGAWFDRSVDGLGVSCIGSGQGLDWAGLGWCRGSWRSFVGGVGCTGDGHGGC